jgi:predicted nucleic acid-binding protein
LASFLDTNVLLYELDAADAFKRETARSLVANLGKSGVISSQVLQEFAFVSTKMMGLSTEQLAKVLDSYGMFKFVPIQAQLVQSAAQTSELSQISFWDALIVEAAVFGRCKVLYTEDLNHGEEIRGVRIVNPFRA